MLNNSHWRFFIAFVLNAAIHLFFCYGKIQLTYFLCAVFHASVMADICKALMMQTMTDLLKLSPLAHLRD